MKIDFKKEKINIFAEKIHLILAILTLLWLNAGLYSYAIPYIPSYIRIAIFLLWFIIALFNKKYIIELIKILLPLLLFLLIMTSSMLYADNYYLNIYFKNFMYIIICTSILLYYINGKRKYRNIIFGVLTFDIIYVLINTLISLNINPAISRYLSAGEKAQEQLLNNTKYYAVGNYFYCYSLVIIVLILIDYLFKNNKSNKFKRFMFIILIILSSVILIKAQFTILLILLLIFSIIVVIQNIIKKTKSKHKVYSICIIMFLIALIIMPMIIEICSQNEQVPFEIRVRMEEIKKAINGENIEDTDLYARIKLYTKSINSFFNNIFVGSAGQLTVGLHSTFLDFIGLYGLLSILLFMFYFNLYKYIKERITNSGQQILNNIWLYYLVLSIINTVLSPIITNILFIYATFLIKNLFERKKENENTLDSQYYLPISSETNRIDN